MSLSGRKGSLQWERMARYQQNSHPQKKIINSNSSEMQSLSICRLWFPTMAPAMGKLGTVNVSAPRWMNFTVYMSPHTFLPAGYSKETEGAGVCACDDGGHCSQHGRLCAQGHRGRGSGFLVLESTRV